MAITYNIQNRKGGVGKTETALEHFMWIFPVAHWPYFQYFPLPVLLPVKKCETFPELFHISLLFPVPFPEAAPQQPVCLLNVFTFFCCHFKFLLCLCIDELKPFQQLCLWIIMFCQLRKFQCMNLKFITIQLPPLIWPEMKTAIIFFIIKHYKIQNPQLIVFILLTQMGRQNLTLNWFPSDWSKYCCQKCVTHLFVFHQSLNTEIYFWLH